MDCVREMYHTQEKRKERLEKPVICIKDNAWLGEAYYFWYSEADANFWGLTAKKRMKYFDIYKSTIDCSNVLDTVFNEEHYIFWVTQIEKVAKLFLLKGKTHVTLKEINDWFKARNVWSKFDGIMFQDISKNPADYYVKEFQYKKRIQLAVYNLNICTNFVHHYEGQCV
jgi:hypothetical protein